MKHQAMSPASFRVAFFIFVIAILLAQAPTLAAGQAPVQGVPATGPKIWLQPNQPLAVVHTGPAAAALSQPLALASADIDGDGVADLVVGYGAPGGGVLAIHRGNVDAFAPQSDESFQAIRRGEFPSPFLLEATTFAVPVRPDFIAIGNFIGNGNRDLLVGAKGGSSVYVLSGDGKGHFGTPQIVNLPGGVTSLAAGELGSAHQSTVVIGLSTGKNNSELAVFAGTPGGLTPIAALPVTGAISNILFGDLGGGPDVAFLAGGKVQILSSTTGKFTTVSLPVSATAFALGSFIFDRNHGTQIALLAADGSVQIAARSEFDPRVYSAEELRAIRSANLNHQPLPAFVPAPSFPLNGWKIVESLPAVASVTPGQTPVFFRTRVASNGSDDIMWLNAGSGQMVLISHPDAKPGGPSFAPGQVSVKPYTGSPVAALPVRINVDGRPGVLAIHRGEVAPSITLPIPDPTFTVNTTTDLVSADPNACLNAVAGQCSLREAVIEANATAGTDTIMVPPGTYTLTIPRAANPVYDARTGTLDVTDSVNIIGGGQATTIIQGGTVGVPGTPNGVDKVFSFNQDITSFTNATVSISNLTIQNGFNRGNTIVTDGWGGAFDFDTGTNGTANLTVSNVTLQNNTLTDGEGGGFAIFNTNNGTGGATFSNCTVQNNIIQPNNVTVGALNFVGSANGGGGFVASPANMTMTGCSIKNNQANSANGHNPVGGGFELLLAQAGTPLVAIHNTSITGNSAGGNGGGIFNTAALQIDQGSIISNNSAGAAGAVNNRDGGGVWFNAGTGHNGTITKSAITGNSANATSGSGGGIFVNGTGGASLTVTFSRLAGNTASSASNLANLSGTVTATNDWWGTNAPASTISGTVTFDPFIVLTHTGSPQKIRINQSSTLTGDMSKDNHGNGAALSGNLDAIVGLPITFDGAVLGTIPQAQPETLGNPVPTATATFNAGGTAGFGTANATVDQAVVPVNSNFIASATESGTTATITTVGAHGFSTGEFVRISGVGVAGYNSSPATQEFTILSTPTATTFTYAANASGLGPSSGGTANAGIIILQPPSITKSFNPATVPINTPSTITFSITNGNVVPIDASFTDNLPANLVVATTPTVVNNCGGSVTATAGSGSISFSNNTLPVGTCTIQVNVQSAVDSTYANSVTIDSTDAGNGNTSSATLTVVNPPSITKTFGAATIPLNGTTSLTFTLNNSNVNTTLNGLAFTDSLPAGLVVATPASLNNTCGGTATATAGSSAVSLSGASLAPGASCTVSVNITGTTAGVKNNSVQVSSTNGGTGNTSNASITVVSPPGISKAFGAASIPLNGTTSLSFTINNPNAVTLTGIGFTDTLPAGLIISTPNGLTGSCGGGTITATQNTNTISLSGASLAASASCTFSVNVTGTAAGVQNNTSGAVTSNEGGTGNTASATIHVEAPPSIAKVFNPSSIALNATTSLTFTITNPATNPDALTGVAFTDTLPTGLTVASSTSSVCGGTLTTTSPTGIALSGATINVNANCQFSVTVTGAASGQYTNTTAAVTSTNGGTGNTASANLSVASPPSITKQFGAASIPLNGTTSLTFTIQNPNSGVTLTGLAFTDSLPAGLVVATPSGLNNTCGGTATATAGSGSLSLSGGTVAASGSCAVTVNVTGTTAGVKNNSVTVSSTNAGTGNTSNASITVVAAPTITKAFGAPSIPLNGSTSLSFTITNPNAVALSGVAFSDTLPAGLVVSTPNGLTGSCGAGTITATQGTNSISLTGGTLAANSSCTFSVNITGTSAGLKNNVSGAVSSTEGGTGGTASASINVVAPPVIAKAFNPASIILNSTTSLTFTITNPSSNAVALTGVAFTDNLPAGLAVASGTSTVCGGTLTTTAPTGIVLSGATIAANGQCQFSVTVTGLVSGHYTNTTGNVSSTNGGTGNTASANLTVGVAAPTITKAFGKASIPLHSFTQLTFTIHNNSATTALTGITFTDPLPSGLVVGQPPLVTNTCGGTLTAAAGSSTITLSGGSLAANASCKISLVVRGVAAGVQNNTTGPISSNESGPGATSNTATVTVVGHPTMSEAFGATTINEHQITTLTFTISNPNATVALNGVAFGDYLPSGLRIASPNGLTGSCSGGKITAYAGSSSISLLDGTIAPSASCTFSVKVVGREEGRNVNVTTPVVAINGGIGNRATATINVIETEGETGDD